MGMLLRRHYGEAEPVPEEQELTPAPEADVAQEETTKKRTRKKKSTEE